ncbi:RHS repeat-associated core domain-containing protein [Treponema sp. OMZ 803]|nr:RHS repeat-associated core domain-containing protein [Treponema sp. OMZ 803]
MKTKFCFYSQLNYSHPRTAIAAKILFAARIMQVRFLELVSGKTPRKQSSSGKKIEAESAVPILVYFYIIIIVHKYRQSAKESCLLKRNTVPEIFPLTAGIAGSGKTKPFEKRHAGCEEREKINRRRIYDTLRINFFEATKETEETHPENLFAYRRNYTWNEKNLLTKSSDRSYTVHYRYGEDGQRALKYTEEGRSETLYFNNFYTIHIPVQDKNNPQGLRVHKHIFVGNSRLVTAMTHTDNNGDNAEQREKRYYYHSDHLGSAQFVTDWRGKQYEHIEYTPYGELWIEEVAAGLDKLPFRFTGKEMDEETGLYYYGARYLDPKYSRWLSGDPALGEYIPAAGADTSKLAGMGGRI